MYNVLYLRKNRFSICTGGGLHCITIAGLGLCAGLALGNAQLLLCQSGHFLPAGVCSLLHGFAPLIGAMLVTGIVAYLLFHLVCAVETELSRENDSPIREPDKKYEWHRLRTNPVTFVTLFLSRTEHSPPVVSVFPI